MPRFAFQYTITSCSSRLAREAWFSRRDGLPESRVSPRVFRCGGEERTSGREVRSRDGDGEDSSGALALLLHARHVGIGAVALVHRVGNIGPLRLRLHDALVDGGVARGVLRRDLRRKARSEESGHRRDGKFAHGFHRPAPWGIVPIIRVRTNWPAALLRAKLHIGAGLAAR